MKFSRSAIVVVALSLFLVAFGAFAKSTGSHGKTVKGSVVSVDEAAKKFSLKGSNGKTTDLMWNDATKVTGPALKAGENATVRYMVRNKENVATSIMTSTPKAAAAPKAAPAVAASAKTTSTTKTATATVKKH
jgi:cytochrome c oxidase assembly protein Cox11